MSGVAVVLRQRHRNNARPWSPRIPRAQKAEDLRDAALSVLALPNLDADGIDNANRVLEMVGDMLDPPRAGWYPKRPDRWRP